MHIEMGLTLPRITIQTMSKHLSDTIKKGFTRAPHRSLLRATGAIHSDSDFDRPFIGVCNSYIDLIPGHLVRRTFENGWGVPCLVAVAQDATGNAMDLALSWAKGIGGMRAGVIETNFKDETETDPFGERAVLCGGSEALVRAGFETLVEAGYDPELAYFECMHELKLIVDLYYEGGLEMMNKSVSDTAEYGGYSRGTRVITETVKKEMEKILEEVQSGAFAREWIAECEAGWPNMSALRSKSLNHPMEVVGKKLRKMMSRLSTSSKDTEPVSAEL